MPSQPLTIYAEQLKKISGGNLDSVAKASIIEINTINKQELQTRLGSLPKPSKIFSELSSYKGFHLTPTSMKPVDGHYKFVVRTVTKKGLDDARVISGLKIKKDRSPLGIESHSVNPKLESTGEYSRKYRDVKSCYEKPLIRSISSYLDTKDLQMSNKLNNNFLIGRFGATGICLRLNRP